MPEFRLLPRLSLKQFTNLLRITLLCTLLTGLYGALHDQVSFAISEEYFTKMKFRQFAWANFGWPPRLFAGIIGFLATWWMGMIGGWILGRLGLAELKEKTGRDYTLNAFAIAISIAAATGAIGAVIGWKQSRAIDLTAWRPWEVHFGLYELPGFIIVAYLHWASYIGGVIGVIVAGICVWKKVRLVRAQELAKK